MTDKFLKQNFQKLELAIFNLIKKRDPNMKLNDQKIEANQYAKFILERYLALESDFNKISENAMGQLKKLAGECSEMVSTFESLSNESRDCISIGSFISNSSDSDLYGFERLRGLIYQIEEIISSALVNPHY